MNQCKQRLRIYASIIVMTKAINTEDMIIDLFRNPRNKHLIGDDATTIYQDKTSITISQDTLNAGVHFDLSFCSPEVVAQRCFCANISDMAAMATVTI